MKILYLTQYYESNIGGYQNQLINALHLAGHKLTILACYSKGKKKSFCTNKNDILVVNVPVWNQFGVNPILKGLIQLMLPHSMIAGIKKYLMDKQYDLILYATPPVTLAKVVKFAKQKYKCKTFLMLKDILPQTYVDLGSLKKNGFIYRILRELEKELYKISTYIGCMSDGNIHYVKKHNPYLNFKKLILFPNTICIPRKNDIFFNEKEKYLIDFGIKKDYVVCLFAGNLGIPQGLEVLLQVIKKLKNSKIFFLIIGKGTEYNKIYKFICKHSNINAKLIPYMPEFEFHNLISLCDIGLILLSSNFSVPNIPDKLTTYMAYSLPIVAATDEATDLGAIIMDKAHAGLWSLASDVNKFADNILFIASNDLERKKMAINAKNFFLNHLTTEKSVTILENICRSK